MTLRIAQREECAMKQSPSSKIRESKLWNIEQFGRGLNLAATSALGHVTVALASAAPELDSTPINKVNKLTDDMGSFVFDGAQSVPFRLSRAVDFLETVMP